MIQFKHQIQGKKSSKLIPAESSISASINRNIQKRLELAEILPEVE